MKKLENHIPIIQAPMAGYTTPELVAAVSNAGAIGSFGFAFSNAERIDSDLSEARKLTDKSINANFFVFAEQHAPSDKDCKIAIDVLDRLPLAADITYQSLSAPFSPLLERQLEPIWKHKPEFLTFHFGLPPKYILQKAQSLGMCVGVTATCLEEAEAIENHGADFVVAQGIQAGGHRGTFSIDGGGDQKLLTFDLLKILKENCLLPIVCAGGIMNGGDIVTYLNEGAAAVQMGTSFLCCDEAGTNPLHKKYVLEERQRKTVYTKGFSGRWAQSIENEFTSSMECKYVLPFPLQNTLTNPLRKFAVKTGNGEYQSLWAGTEFKKARALPAAELISQLVSEMGGS
ncbi:nitronate monooxygenase [Gammaproteobacteria bacterium]|nr:nitronate monooxygenase [Gammaproteobacteria bacterium]